MREGFVRGIMVWGIYSRCEDEQVWTWVPSERGRINQAVWL